MFLEPEQQAGGFTETLVEHRGASRWGASSETGRLTDVLLCAPTHLRVMPCNAVARSSLASGLACCSTTASGQHAVLASMLERAGVRTHFVPPQPHLPDLSFTRDAALMTPWGLLALRPAEAHRRAEVDFVVRAAEALGVPCLGALGEGRIEGGDICILRPGLLLIGYSGERTDTAGAQALARLFEDRGWQTVYSCFDPQFLHLDTQFAMLSPGRAVACAETLGDGFVDRLSSLGIEIVPATPDEVERLGANLLSLGEGRIVVPAANRRLNQVLRGLGYTLIEVEVDQFVRCGGGVHCLTLPLARDPD